MVLYFYFHPIASEVQNQNKYYSCFYKASLRHTATACLPADAQCWIPDTLLPLFLFPLHSVTLTLFTFVLSIFYLFIFLDSFTNCCLLSNPVRLLLFCTSNPAAHSKHMHLYGYYMRASQVHNMPVGIDIVTHQNRESSRKTHYWASKAIVKFCGTTEENS